MMVGLKLIKFHHRVSTSGIGVYRDPIPMFLTPVNFISMCMIEYLVNSLINFGCNSSSSSLSFT